MARRKEGSFVEIELSNGKYSYGRILKNASFAFYEIFANNKIVDINNIKDKNILFTIAVYNHAITKNRWKIIGFLDIEDKLRTLPMKFIQDAINPTQFEIYNPNTGEIKSAQKNQCLGLERAAVWEPEQVEDRIIDHFEGIPNKWFESLKIKD